jgi:hypothetical protein
MPKGPKGQRRPADVIGNAVKMMRIATGEEAGDLPDDGKGPAAKSLGKRGGEARAKALSKSRKINIARNAARARWAKSWPCFSPRGGRWSTFNEPNLI